MFLLKRLLKELLPKSSHEAQSLTKRMAQQKNRSSALQENEYESLDPFYEAGERFGP